MPCLFAILPSAAFCYALVLGTLLLLLLWAWQCRRSGQTTAGVWAGVGLFFVILGSLGYAVISQDLRERDARDAGAKEKSEESAPIEVRPVRVDRVA